jgi:hypothetical protein
MPTDLMKLLETIFVTKLYREQNFVRPSLRAFTRISLSRNVICKEPYFGVINIAAILNPLQAQIDIFVRSGVSRLRYQRNKFRADTET